MPSILDQIAYCTPLALIFYFLYFIWSYLMLVQSVWHFVEELIYRLRCRLFWSIFVRIFIRTLGAAIEHNTNTIQC